MNILSKDCVGCRACELACSFHHKGVFNPEVSSIKSEFLSDIFEITVLAQTDGIRFGCDGCKGEDEKLCVKYCNFPVRNVIRELLLNI